MQLFALMHSVKWKRKKKSPILSSKKKNRAAARIGAKTSHTVMCAYMNPSRERCKWKMRWIWKFIIFAFDKLQHHAHLHQEDRVYTTQQMNMYEKSTRQGCISHLISLCSLTAERFLLLKIVLRWFIITWNEQKEFRGKTLLNGFNNNIKYNRKAEKERAMKRAKRTLDFLILFLRIYWCSLQE